MRPGPAHFGDARSIAEKIVSSGRAWVAAAKFEGRESIRVCVTHGQTTPDDVIELVNATRDCRGRINARLLFGRGLTLYATKASWALGANLRTSRSGPPRISARPRGTFHAETRARSAL